jgi:hypothetical protein
MSKHGKWTIVFPDQLVIKRTGEFDLETAQAYLCGGTDFWLQPKFSNIHAIQFTDDNVDNDQVEYKDHAPNSGYDASLLGDFQQFINLWDAHHLSIMQETWDNNNNSTVENETVEEKITRLGARPTTYSS